MKKTLLLSVVASTMIMAGGDIAPVEPAVVTPAPAPAPAAAPVAAPVASGWKFSGQAVVYYQTDDVVGISGLGTDDDLFSQGSSSANAGLQLTATNDNLIGGIGFGAQLNGLGTLGLENDVVSGVMQTATEPTLGAQDNDGMDASNLNGAYFSQLYLTYGIGNTSFKVGRQELPKALSPFAFSEDWSVFKNTYNAALVVNTDLPDTVLVGAWVRDYNWVSPLMQLNFTNKLSMNNFDNPINGNDGIWMLTAQNKSIADLTLTGSWYYAKDALGLNENLNILWGDAQYNAGVANIGLQGGAVMSDAFTTDTKAFGAKVSGKFDMINAYVAYSHVNDGDLPMLNVGGNTSVLYTDTALNQVLPMQEIDNNKFVVSANADVLGGNLAGTYAFTSDGVAGQDDTNEFDLAYSTKITENLVGTLAYVYVDDNDINNDDINLIRAVARYNF